MIQPRFTAKTWNDAGLLREYVGAHYAVAFLADAFVATRTREGAMRMAKRLAALTGIDLREIVLDLRADAEIILAE